MDRLLPNDLVWLLEAHYEAQREELELLGYVIKMSVASAHSGKDIKLFKDAKKVSNTVKVYKSKEDKLLDFNSLKDSIL